MNSESLVKEFINELLKKPFRKTKKLFVVATMGLPGSGKSTIANKISDLLKIPIASNDEIRGFLITHGLKESQVEETMEEIIAKRRDYYFKHKASFIMDADTWPHWQKIGKLCSDNGAEMLLVKAEAKEEEILLRLSRRTKSNGEYNAGLKDYLRRKKRWLESDPPKEIFFIFDTERNIDKQMSEFFNLIKLKGFI